MSARGRLAVGALRWGYRLEAGLAALVDPAALRARAGDRHAAGPGRADDGLEPAEEQALTRTGVRSGRALCAACAGGRGARALAGRGLEAACAAVGPEGPELGDGRYDLIALLDLGYSLVPTRRGRAALLARCRARLTPTGRCLLSFSVREPGRAERSWHPALRVLAALAGNAGYELGDRVDATPAYFRLFPSAEIVAEEAREAGFSGVELLSPTPFGRFAVLGP